MNKPINFKKYSYLQPACLPVHGLTTDSSRCIAMGWGRTSTAEDAISPLILQETPLPTMDPDYCESRNRVYDPRLQLCAGYTQGGISVCYGDSGGPLVCPFPNGVWVVEGIASYIVDYCAAPNHPAVFTRVYGYLSWIKRITRLS